ncbi:hypothetical protein VP01_15638g1 [Puccinia sorghi]|uniref:Uncharacterized protein n=1 Tax=Puccinia sorghi TaxID=27349 RepID=A0A0L6VJU1_9BASI|nr:hypothetical protein VP01_15638g1 [Puccinia sorghi]
MCQLSISKAEDKHTEEYLQKFLQVNDQDGNQTANPVRSWKKTIEHSYHLFDIGFYSTVAEYDRLTKKYGVKDWINEKIIEQKNKPEIIKTVKEMVKEHSTASNLFNPFLTLQGKIFSLLLC